jgi:membrane protein DedA with SNARE-associated domain
MTFPTPTIDITYVLRYGYPALFGIIMLSEVTSFIPVGVVLIGVGALARTHYTSLVIALLVATSASTISDYVVFAVSRKLGKAESYRRFVQKSTLASRLEGYIHAHPKATIFLSRLVGLASTPVNALAGLSQMHVPTFLAFDTLGNALCGFIYLAAGFLIGAAWQQDAKVTSIAIGIMLAVGVTAYLIWHFLRSRTQSKS